MTQIIIVGMARSGTTFLSRALGDVLDLPVVVEPHLLWRRGVNTYLADDIYTVSPLDSEIRECIEESVGGSFIEKSPINSLRAFKVYSAFPNAKIIFVSRRAQLVIDSNIKRSLARDQFSISVFIEKFIRKKGGGALASNREVYIPLAKQIKGYYRYFIVYSIKGLLSTWLDRLPFGPRISGWKKFEGNLNEYYSQVLNDSLKQKEIYRRLYDENFHEIQMDDFDSQFKSILVGIGMPYSQDEYSKIILKAKAKINK